MVQKETVGKGGRFRCCCCSCTDWLPDHRSNRREHRARSPPDAFCAYLRIKRASVSVNSRVRLSRACLDKSSIFNDGELRTKWCVCVCSHLNADRHTTVQCIHRLWSRACCPARGTDHPSNPLNETKRHETKRALFRSDFPHVCHEPVLANDLVQKETVQLATNAHLRTCVGNAVVPGHSPSAVRSVARWVPLTRVLPVDLSS